MRVLTMSIGLDALSLRSVSIYATMFFLFGCATSKDIADQSTKGNIGIEDAHNQMLLLNAVRASKHRPMYFTGISQISGPLGFVSPTYQAAIPFTSPVGSVAANTVVTPTVKPDVPGFVMLTLDGQKFIQGITKPLKPSLVKYYLDQGWPTQFLLSLVIRDITYEWEDGTEERFVNYPADEQFDKFQDELSAMVACGLRFKPRPAEPVSGPALHFKDESNASDLIAAAKEKLSITKVKKDGTEWTLARPSEDVGIYFTTLDSSECEKWPEQKARFLYGGLKKEPSANAPSETESEKIERLKAQTDPSSGSITDAADKTAKEKLKLFVRSPEAILYYLGELIRVQVEGDNKRNTSPKLTKVRYSPTIIRDEAIFKLSSGDSPNKFVTVEYAGREYSIDSVPPYGTNPGDRSSHALSFVSQLIGLQKEAADLPQTTQIRLITQ